MQIPLATFKKDVSDVELSKHMRAQWKSSTHSYSWADPSRESTSVSADYRPGKRRQNLLPSARDDELTPTMVRLLESIRDEPYMPSAARYKTINLSVRKCTAAIKKSVAQGFITEITISTEGKGRPGKYFEFTNKAEGMLGQQSLGKGKGGFKHKFWQHRIKHHFENLGHKVEIEAYVDGKSVDVGVWKVNRRIAYEVEMSAAHTYENIVKDLAAGWDEVIMAYADEAIGRKARQELSMRRDTLKEGWYEKVSFIPLTKLLK